MEAHWILLVCHKGQFPAIVRTGSVQPCSACPCTCDIKVVRIQKGSRVNHEPSPVLGSVFTVIDE